MINVYDDEGNIIALVKYTTNLDFWDGNNMTCGMMGVHKGLTKLKDGRFVLVHSSQWEGNRDSAAVVEPQEALREILLSENTELLDKYPELKTLRAETLIGEED